jgi:hypothetical protein
MALKFFFVLLLVVTISLATLYVFPVIWKGSGIEIEEEENERTEMLKKEEKQDYFYLSEDTEYQVLA